MVEYAEVDALLMEMGARRDAVGERPYVGELVRVKLVCASCLVPFETDRGVVSRVADDGRAVDFEIPDGVRCPVCGYG